MPTSWLLQWDTRNQRKPRLFGVAADGLPTVQEFHDDCGSFAVLDGYLSEQPPTARPATSDAERLVALSQEKGEAALEDLSGAFLAIYWNAKKQRLSILRDATGQQTAYFCWRNGTLLVAPCLETLLAAPDVGRDLNRPLIAELLQLRFHDQQIKETLFADVRRLPPGHRLALHRQRLIISRYWKPEEFELDGVSNSGRELDQALETALQRSLKTCGGIELVNTLPSIALAVAAGDRFPGRKLPALIPDLASSGEKRPLNVAQELGFQPVPVFTALGSTISPASTMPCHPRQLLRSGLFETAAAAHIQHLLLADDPGASPRKSSWPQFLTSFGKGSGDLSSRQLPIWYRSFFKPHEDSLRRLLQHRQRYARPLKNTGTEHLVRSGKALMPNPVSLLEREHDAAIARQHGVAPIYPLADRDLMAARIAAASPDLSSSLTARLRGRLPNISLPEPNPASIGMSVRHKILEHRKKLQGFPRLQSLGLVTDESLENFADGYFAGRHPYGLTVWMALSFETWLSTTANHPRSWESLVASAPPKCSDDTTTLHLGPAAFAS